MDIEFPPGTGYDAASRSRIVSQMVERFKTVPGVKLVTEGRVPLAGGLRMTAALLDVSPNASNNESPIFYYSYATPDYFEALSIPIVQGRAFTESEARSGAHLTAISEATARALWPGRDPIGKSITLDARKQFHVADEPFPSGERVEVIGVSKDIRSAWLNEVDQGHFVLPLPPGRYGEVMIRTENNPNALVAALGADVKAVDPNVIVYAESLDGLITMNPGFVFSRVGAVFSTIVGLLGLLLASVGVYGMVSYAVLRRTHEVGVRMALGARRRDVLGLILRQSARPVVIGMLIGLVSSAVVSRLLSALLFGISPFDVVAFGGVSAFLMLVSLLACYLPARRATKVDPLVALRYE
ncbi:MAG TPA: FtsX-like permease family protein [Terriglobia bacterium]|nr:FtsX-like permease family protein [Terriglobia bacterium]